MRISLDNLFKGDKALGKFKIFKRKYRSFHDKIVFNYTTKTQRIAQGNISLIIKRVVLYSYAKKKKTINVKNL